MRRRTEIIMTRPTSALGFIILAAIAVLWSFVKAVREYNRDQ